MVAHHLVFLNRSYYCYECDRGFNTEDYEHHPCEGRKCVSCYRMNCPEFRRHEEPSGKSGKCLRSFYGEERTRTDKIVISTIWAVPIPAQNLFAKCTRSFLIVAR